MRSPQETDGYQSDEWQAQVDMKLLPELDAAKHRIKLAIDQRVLEGDDREIARSDVLEAIRTPLYAASNGGNSPVQEDPLRESIAKIEDPLVKAAATASADFILGLQRKTNVPIYVGLSFVAYAANRAILQSEAGHAPRQN